MCVNCVPVSQQDMSKVINLDMTGPDLTQPNLTTIQDP